MSWPIGARRVPRGTRPCKGFADIVAPLTPHPSRSESPRRLVSARVHRATHWQGNALARRAERNETSLFCDLLLGDNSYAIAGRRIPESNLWPPALRSPGVG